MKRLTILPGAAGIIALTATIGFVDGQREVESEKYSRERISLVGGTHKDMSATAVAATIASGSRDQPAYLVEFMRGGRSGHVLIDAATGRVIAS